MTTAATEARVLVLAPTGRDAEMTCEALRGAGVAAEPCATMSLLCTATAIALGLAVTVALGVLPQPVLDLADRASRFVS